MPAEGGWWVAAAAHQRLSLQAHSAGAHLVTLDPKGRLRRSPMYIPATKELIRTLYHTHLALVREAGHDLTARQMTVFLTCFLESRPQTVRALAGRLNVSRPAISRTLDRLEEFDLVKRRIDPSDRRSVIILRRRAGWSLFQRIQEILTQAALAASSDDTVANAFPGGDPVSPLHGLRQSDTSSVDGGAWSGLPPR